ncbi:MAG: hypothetical protein WCO33_02525 [bacterium]
MVSSLKKLVTKIKNFFRKKRTVSISDVVLVIIIFVITTVLSFLYACVAVQGVIAANSYIITHILYPPSFTSQINSYMTPEKSFYNEDVINDLFKKTSEKVNYKFEVYDSLDPVTFGYNIMVKGSDYIVNNGEWYTDPPIYYVNSHYLTQYTYPSISSQYNLNQKKIESLLIKNTGNVQIRYNTIYKANPDDTTYTYDSVGKLSDYPGIKSMDWYIGSDYTNIIVRAKGGKEMDSVCFKFDEARFLKNFYGITSDQSCSYEFWVFDYMKNLAVYGSWDKNGLIIADYFRDSFSEEEWSREYKKLDLTAIDYCDNNKTILSNFSSYGHNTYVTCPDNLLIKNTTLEYGPIDISLFYEPESQELSDQIKPNGTLLSIFNENNQYKYDFADYSSRSYKWSFFDDYWSEQATPKKRVFTDKDGTKIEYKTKAQTASFDENLCRTNTKDCEVFTYYSYYINLKGIAVIIDSVSEVKYENGKKTVIPEDTKAIETMESIVRSMR